MVKNVLRPLRSFQSLHGCLNCIKEEPRRFRGRIPSNPIECTGMKLPVFVFCYAIDLLRQVLVALMQLS